MPTEYGSSLLGSLDAFGADVEAGFEPGLEPVLTDVV